MSADVTIVGSINIDISSYLERWPRVGETIAAHDSRMTLGGKGANQAVAAARLGASVQIVGAIGQDALGRQAEDALAAHGVASLLHRSDAQTTGTASIDIGPDGRNIIRVAAGANGTLSPALVRDQQAAISASRVVLLQNEIPIEASLEAAKIARAAGATVLMDPAPAPRPFWSADVLQAFDVITPNEEEVGAITGSVPVTLDEAAQAITMLLDRGARGAVVTMGAQGVAWSIQQACGAQSAPTVRAVDTVAAGDCFNGALAAALARGEGWGRAIDIAVHAAALATTRLGAAESAPDRDELDTFILTSTESRQHTSANAVPASLSALT
ncbi:MAG: ribokinase [Devosiaceae bacterium]|nr:ribokinase [Devosiaceae bacterium MH13]